MKRNNDRVKMLYLEKEKCIYSIFLSILLYVFVAIIFNDAPILQRSVISIAYLIGACTIVLLSQAILNIYKKSYYKVVSLCYIVAAVFCIYNIIPIELINYKWIMVLRNNVFLRTMNVQIVALCVLNINNYVFNNNRRIEMCKIMLISAVNFMINYIFLISGRVEFILISNILLIILLVIESAQYRKIKFQIGNEINSMLCLIYMYIMIVLLNILYLKFLHNNVYVAKLNSIIGFTAYVFLILIIIDKLINRPYRLLFSDLYKENLEMDRLNGEVVTKNRELEFSQSIIRKKEKMFKNFFISSPIPLVLISKNGRVIFANSSFQKLIEEDNIKNIINRKIFNIININNVKNFDDLINKEVKDLSGMIKCNNNNKYVNIEVMDIHQNNNEYLVILNDVTAKVKIGKLRTEMENNKFQEKIKSDFLSNISHDLKTPINVIYSASQLVTIFIKNHNEEDLKKYNMICKLNCFGLIRLTNNLIDSSRIYSDYLSPNLQVKNIVELIEEVVTSLIDYAKSKNINLIFDTDEEEIYMKIDDEFIQRIIINLVSNSIKFTNEEGKIEVIIHNTEKEVVINIKDNGIGMEKEFIKKAFTRYTMGKNNQNSNTKPCKGTGIGLFVVKKLVEKQNGKISIESELNKGTNVEMRFNKEL